MREITLALYERLNVKSIAQVKLSKQTNKYTGIFRTLSIQKFPELRLLLASRLLWISLEIEH